MITIRSFMGGCLAACVVALAIFPAAAASPTLDGVKKRGHLLCGVNGLLPGFSVQNERGDWIGFEVELCRAVAAATLGDATKVKFVPLTAGHRFDALRKREVDVLLRNSTATLERTVGLGVRDAVVYFLDAQAVAVRRVSGITELYQLGGKRVCILNNTPYGRNLRDWLAFRKLSYTPVTFDTQDAMYKAFYDDKCDAVTQDIAALSASIIASGKGASHVVLPATIGLEPNAAYVRAGDEAWFDVIRWTVFALLDAEERGITRSNVDAQIAAGDAPSKRLLGSPGDDGKLLGLSGSWAFNVIKQVGNYGEIFDRTLGEKTQWKFPRGVTALWNRGGVMYGLPLR